MQTTKLSYGLFKRYGTTLWRRVGMAFFICSVVGPTLATRDRHHELKFPEWAYWALGTGVSGAVAVLLLEMKAAFRRRGGRRAKIVGLFLYVLGLLICVALLGFVVAQFMA